MQSFLSNFWSKPTVFLLSFHHPSDQCPPGYTCTFEVGLTNEGGATDVFDVSLDTATIPNDWSVGLAWSQDSSVLLRPNETVQALFTLTTPSDAAPDTVVEFDLSLTSQNDTSRAM